MNEGPAEPISNEWDEGVVGGPVAAVAKDEVAKKVIEKVAEKLTAPKAKPAPAVGETPKSGVPAFCRANGINPKLARAALRKANFHAPYTLNQKTRDIILSAK
jgi:hypothetical protein